jgi:hypothetical protein
MRGTDRIGSSTIAGSTILSSYGATNEGLSPTILELVCLHAIVLLQAAGQILQILYSLV